MPQQCLFEAFPMLFCRPRRAERGRKQIVAGRYSYETWLTLALSELHLPHKAAPPYRLDVPMYIYLYEV